MNINEFKGQSVKKIIIVRDGKKRRGKGKENGEEDNKNVQFKKENQNKGE